MERKDHSFTTAEGQKVYGSPYPPENLEQELKKQEEEEFERSKELLKGMGQEIKPAETLPKKNRKVVEMPKKSNQESETKKAA